VNLYHYPDAHLNALGHRVAAEAIAEDAAAMSSIRGALGLAAAAAGGASSAGQGTPLQ
jgi:hypothetical protein